MYEKDDKINNDNTNKITPKSHKLGCYLNNSIMGLDQM